LRSIKNSRRGLLTAAALTLLVASACGGPGAASPTPGGSPGGQLGGSVSILATWTGTEEESFRAMIQPWVDSTGVTVNYQGTRDMGSILSNAIQAGGAGLPDVAGVPGPGEAAQWAEAGALKELSFINLADYQASSSLADLGVIDGKLYGIFTKAAVKGLIWYNTATYDGTVPATYADLEAIDPGDGSLWCNAWESGGDSGWPGTDWVEDFVIRESGPDVYDSWVAGNTKWTDPAIKSAFEAVATVIGQSAGGGTYINATNFFNVGDGLFADTPTCKFVHQASFISTDGFEKVSGATAGEYDFFVMPTINSEFAGAITGGGDEFGMFNDTPQARSLIQYLITAEAQAIWAGRGGYIAANKNVPTSAYKDASDKKAGEAVAAATVFRFDGGDNMPGAMKAAFFDAMVELASNPANIDSILAELDTVQEQAYSDSGASPSP
jgi:alpha-glucoside transport system substrate-binding protein